MMPNGDFAEKAETIGETLAGMLASAGEVQDVSLITKYWSWAKSLAQKEPLSLDKADKKSLESFVQTDKRMNVILKAQILEIIEKAPSVKKVIKEAEPETEPVAEKEPEPSN
jgi:hypothetical protein